MPTGADIFLLSLAVALVTSAIDWRGALIYAVLASGVVTLVDFAKVTITYFVFLGVRALLAAWLSDGR